MSEVPQAGSTALPRFRWLAIWAVGTLSFVVSNAHTGVTSRWYDDLGLIRTLGMWPLGAQGLFSCVLGQLTLALPVANRVYRAALVANLGAVACALLFFELMQWTLAQNARTPRLTLLFAMLGAALLAVGGPMQRNATCAGGASVAVALALGALVLDPKTKSRRDREPPRRALFLVGLLLVAASAERFWAGAAALCFIAGRRLLARESVALGDSRRVFVGVLTACLAFSVPLLRMQMPHRLVPELPSLAASLGDTWSGMFHVTMGGLRIWKDAGLLLSIASLAGAIWGLWRRVLRPATFGWLLVLALACVFGAADSPLSESPAAALRILAFAACVALATITAQTLALGLLKVRVSYLGASVIVVVTLYAMLVAVHADDADFAAEGRAHRGNAVFTEEAFWVLPRRSVLLVQHRELAYRAWASRLADGVRGDLLILTPARLQHNPDASRLLAMEPALAPLVREMVIRGRPTEYSLSQLADARTLFIELDPTWDARLREHVGARGLWSEFHSQSLGRSDRYNLMNSTRLAVDRVIDECKSSVPADTTTLRVVSLRLKEQASVFASFGDRVGLYPILDQLGRMGTEAPYVAAAKSATERKPHGPIDWDFMAP